MGILHLPRHSIKSRLEDSSLRGFIIFVAVVARNQEAPPTTPPTSVPEPVKMDAPTKSTPSTRDVIEMSPTLDRSSPRLDDRGDSAIAILIPRPTSGQVLNLTRIRSPSVSTIVGFSPSSRALARYYFPAANIVVLEDHLSAEVHDQLIQYIRIAFYCLLIIGLSAVTFGVLAFLHVRRRSAQMARKAAEARQNLGDFPSLLWWALYSSSVQVFLTHKPYPPHSRLCIPYGVPIRQVKYNKLTLPTALPDAA